MKISKKIKVLDFKLSKILNGCLFGAYKSRFSGSGMEFSEHRQYHFGDHVKNIDWKASSKTDEMFIKNYEEERDLNVLFFLDNTESMSFGSNNITKNDLLIEVFYSLSSSAYYNNDNIGGAILTENNIEFINYKKSKNNIYKIIDILDKENKVSTKRIKDKINSMLKYLILNKINNNLVFLLTDSMDELDEKSLRLVSSKNDVIIINIFDYFENNLSSLLENLVINEGKGFVDIDLSSNEKLNIYRKNRINKIKYLKNILEKNRVGYIEIDTKNDIFEKLISYFNKIKE